MKPAAFPTKTAHAAGLALFAGAEAFLFLVVARHHYAWSYPRWNDQVQYLGQAYGTFDLARSDGYARGAWAALRQVNAQGCLHGLLTLPIFAVAGASRTAALAINILAFIALQVATYLAVRRLSGRASLAWASVGLLAALHFPWSGGVGSAVDFRLDWMAACAYGVTLAVALPGRGFRSTGWAVLFGAAVGASILVRFLTAVYFGLIFIMLLCWLLAGRNRRGGCWRLTLSGFVAFCIVAPEFWRNRGTIYSYYWVGHYVGPERALRDSHFGALESVKWILSQVLLNQVGLAALALGLGAAALFRAFKADPGARQRPSGGPDRPSDGAWALTLAFLAAPAIALASHPIKTEPSACILIAPVIWINLLLWIRFSREVGRKAAVAVSSGVLCVGALVFAFAQDRSSELDGSAADFRGINGLADFLFYRSEEAGLTHPRIGVTWILGGTDSETLRILGYERHGRMLPFVAVLPTGLFAPSREVAMNALKYCDFVCLVTRATPVWPFDRQMAELLPDMRAWCDGHMTSVGRLDTAGFSALVYESPALGRRPGGVDLASMMRAASRGPAYGDPGTPAPPVFTSSAHAVGSTRSEFRCTLVAAYSPVRYEAVGLPDGLRLNAVTGEIRGRLPRPGIFRAQVRVSNSLGSASESWEVHVEDSDWFAFLNAQPACTAGVPFDVDFGAYDRGGNLDFIDVTDLTTRKTLERLEVREDEKQAWCGIHRLTLEETGPHLILMRFARYDPSARDPTSFVDHAVVIEAKPRH